MKLGFCGILGIVFIVLKLTGFIDWVWVWVLAPLWIPVLTAVAFLAIVKIMGKIADYNIDKITKEPI